MIILIVVLTFAVLSVGSWVAYVLLDSYMSVRSAPREEMIFCPKHGPIRKSAALNFMGHDYCGICFHERLAQAEKGVEPRA